MLVEVSNWRSYFSSVLLIPEISDAGVFGLYDSEDLPTLFALTLAGLSKW
jgi:hypothetical protein